jgi:hypothetical protein
VENKISFEELEATATPPATVTPVETPVATPPAVPAETKPQFTETDVEAYKQLVDMGITPQNASEFKAAKQALENLPMLLKNNPDLLLDEIEKNDPELHKTLLEKVSDRWFNRLPSDVREGKSNGNGSESRTVSSATNPVIERLERQVNALVQERTQEKTDAQQKIILSGLNTAFENLVAKLPAGVTERDKDYIRLKAERLLWSDGNAAKRINQGVYVDVPTYFSKAASLVTAETKAAATAANDKRAGVEARGERTIPNAAENVNGTTAKQDGHGKDPIWGDISESELKSAYK